MVSKKEQLVEFLLKEAQHPPEAALQRLFGGWNLRDRTSVGDDDAKGKQQDPGFTD